MIKISLCRLKPPTGSLAREAVGANNDFKHTWKTSAGESTWQQKPAKQLKDTSEILKGNYRLCHMFALWAGNAALWH